MAGVRRWVGGLLPGAKERRLQVAANAAAWLTANEAAATGDGPLWVVLGDSTAQAVGASSIEHGYVGQLRARLDEADGRRWRVVNLSRTGDRVRDVVGVQLVALRALPVRPDLVTCAIGANDLLPGRGRDLEAELAALLDALPAGAVVATLPQGIRQGRAAELNDVIRARAVARGLVVADVWAVSGPPWNDRFSSDHFHPNDRGYAAWADAFAEALGLDPGGPGGDR